MGDVVWRGARWRQRECKKGAAVILKCSNGHVHDTSSSDLYESRRVIGGKCDRRVGGKQCGAMLHLVHDENGIAPRFVTGRLVANYPHAHIALVAPSFAVNRGRGQMTLCRRGILHLCDYGMDAGQIAASILAHDDDMCRWCLRVFVAIYGEPT